MMSTILSRSRHADLSCIVAGDGPPVLLLHGVGLQAAAWGPQIDALSGRYQVIAPDMPGHGDSPAPTAQMTLDGYADRMLPVLDNLPQPALVVGHSMGAQIALELAIRAPAQVWAVAALNAIFERTSQAAAAVKARADTLDGATAPDPAPTLARWFGSAASPERAACEHWLRTVDPMGYKLAYTAFAGADGPRLTDLSRLNCPAVFATGALEPNSTPAMSRAMAALAPQGRAVIVKGAAHMMPLTHPDAVNAALFSLAGEVWA